MGEFDDLAEIVAASTRDWDDGTLGTSCVVYAAACYLSPLAIVTGRGEFEDFAVVVEFVAATATLRVSWIGTASLFQQGSAVGVS